MSSDLGKYPDILRAQEWVWHYMLGKVTAAVVEQSGPLARTIRCDRRSLKAGS